MKLNKSFIRLTIFAVVILFSVGGVFLWWKDATGPYDANSKEQIVFTIEKGESVKEIAARLSKENLIRSSLGFYILIKTLGIERQMQAGDYRLSQAMDSRTIASSLTHGMMDAWLTILEGWRTEEIATKLAKEMDIPEKEFLRVASEGYMFPDTYRVPEDASAASIAALFRENFTKKVTPELLSNAKKEGLSLGEFVTLASIVEREGRTNEDRPMIAGILLNRLREDWPLQTDATLQYALGYQTKAKTWWKKELMEEDKSVDSPYNTYTHTGLPPGPIANPGLAALTAVAYPKKTDYMFYLHDPKGNVHYAKTVEEHNANVEKYLQ